MKRPPVILAAAALFALPAIATAHTATVTCDPANPGRYLITADFLQFNPVPVFGPATVTVTWSDRYVRVLPLPTGCVAPPSPVVPVPPVVPPAVPPAVAPPVLLPPVITPGGPEQEPVVRTTPRTVRVTCGLLRAHHAGPREYLRRGWYVGCRAPHPRVVRHIPVTG